MARRRNLNGLATVVLSSFLSRNNDVEGYWALGKLYLNALQYRQRKVVIDFLSGTLSPPGEQFASMVKYYREMFFGRLVPCHLSEVNVAALSMSIEFEVDDGQIPVYVLPDQRLFSCRLVVTDDQGKIYESTGKSWCHPHDPKRENRRHQVRDSTETYGK